MASPANPGKTMSSRLLTMKFMQRAAASPSSTPNSTNTTPDTHRSKRQRYSGATPTTPATPTAHEDALKAAHAVEEAKRAKASELEAARVGETRWVLSFQDPTAGKGTQADGALRVITGGYADIDGSDEELTGRFNFGKKEVEPKLAKDEASEDSEDSGDSEDDSENAEDEDNEDDPTAALIKEERRKATEQARLKLKQRRRDKEKKMSKLGDTRRRKEVKLNGPARARRGSPTGVNRGPLSKSTETKVCHLCGKTGHIKPNCPQNKDKGFGRGEKLTMNY